jgi:hypothetical protein
MLRSNLHLFNNKINVLLLLPADLQGNNATLLAFDALVNTAEILFFLFVLCYPIRSSFLEIIAIYTSNHAVHIVFWAEGS